MRGARACIRCDEGRAYLHAHCFQVTTAKPIIFSSALRTLRVNMTVALGSQSFLSVLDGLVNIIIKSYSEKIHPGTSEVISELEHRSLCGRNQRRTVNLEEQYEKSARAHSERTENPVGDTDGSVRMATGMETFHNYCAFIT